MADALPLSFWRPFLTASSLLGTDPFWKLYRDGVPLTSTDHFDRASCELSSLLKGDV